MIDVIASFASHCIAPRRRGLRLLVALAVGYASAPAVRVAQAQDGPSLVVLVRHAEKAAQPADDPSLTDAGRDRAAALALAVAHAPPSAIVVSSRKRTAETGVPTATKFGITPTVVSLDGGAAAHIAAVVAAVRSQRGVVLVIGHSNTIPAVIKALGGPALPDICDASYNLLFTLLLAKDGRPASLVVSQYGAANETTGTAAMAAVAPAAVAPACAGMK